jgi:ribonuclease BN (tRNA processing enzyme)
LWQVWQTTKKYHPPGFVSVIAISLYSLDQGVRCEFQAGKFKIFVPSLRYIFITHYHSDHNAEFRVAVKQM